MPHGRVRYACTLSVTFLFVCTCASCAQSDQIDSYIRECMEMVKDVDLILSTIKDNVTATQQLLKTWEKNLMFDRKEGKVSEAPTDTCG